MGTKTPGQDTLEPEILRLIDLYVNDVMAEPDTPSHRRVAGSPDRASRCSRSVTSMAPPSWIRRRAGSRAGGRDARRRARVRRRVTDRSQQPADAHPRRRRGHGGVLDPTPTPSLTVRRSDDQNDRSGGGCRAGSRCRSGSGGACSGLRSRSRASSARGASRARARAGRRRTRRRRPLPPRGMAVRRGLDGIGCRHRDRDGRTNLGCRRGGGRARVALSRRGEVPDHEDQAGDQPARGRREPLPRRREPHDPRVSRGRTSQRCHALVSRCWRAASSAYE